MPSSSRRKVLYLRGSMPRTQPWDVMVDSCSGSSFGDSCGVMRLRKSASRFFWRDPEEIMQQEAGAATLAIIWGFSRPLSSSCAGCVDDRMRLPVENCDTHVLCNPSTAISHSSSTLCLGRPEPFLTCGKDDSESLQPDVQDPKLPL